MIFFLYNQLLFLGFSSHFLSFLSPLHVSPPASPPRSVVLDCHHVSIIDFTVISEFRDLLRQFKLREVLLVFARLKVTQFLGQHYTKQNICSALCFISFTHTLSVFLPPVALCSGGSPNSWPAGLQVYTQCGGGAADGGREPPWWLTLTPSNHRLERRCLMLAAVTDQPYIWSGIIGLLWS